MPDYAELNSTQPESEVDPFTIDRYHLFFKNFPKGPNRFVLDIGCNTGRGGEALKSLDESLFIHGLDIVGARLEKLPKSVYSKVTVGSATNIPIESEHFHVVTAGEFIEHLYPTDVEPALNEMYRVCKIGGRVLLTTPNPGDIKRKLRGEHILGGAHVSQHHAQALIMRMKMIGFSKVKVYGSGRVTRYLGVHFPVLGIYGSYMIVATK